jgi:Co/Zn/Cd efflux system component
VHYLHAWSVSSSSIAFSCHVEVKGQSVSQTEALGEKSSMNYSTDLASITLYFSLKPFSAEMGGDAV